MTADDSATVPEAHIDLTLPGEWSCGFALVDYKTGEQYPCDRPGVSWRWYQGHDHEDALDRSCERHENVGGIRMAALIAEVQRLRAALAEVDVSATTEGAQQ